MRMGIRRFHGCHPWSLTQIAELLDETSVMDDPHAIVAQHLRLAFVRAFGAAKFEVWSGKDGSREHTGAEAEAAASALAAPSSSWGSSRDRISPRRGAVRTNAPRSGVAPGSSN
jgi:hypothetical protein